MTNKVVLLTGATGFVGRAIASDLVEAGWQVRAMSRRSAPGPWQESVEGDVASPERWPMDDVDVVVHAAGLAHDTRGIAAGLDDYTRVNAQGSMNAAAACARSGCRSLVLISSVKAMADRTSAVPLTESDACNPTTPYGRSKLEGERLAKRALEGSGCRLAVVRLPPVYGPGGKGNLERLLGAARKRWMPLLPAEVGERSMVHVRDVAALVLAALDRQAAGTFIAEDGLHYTPRSIQQHARASLGLSGRTLAIPASPLRVTLGLARRGQGLAVLRRIEADLARVVDRCVFDGTRTRRTLSWTPERTLWDEMDHLLARTERVSNPPR